MKVEASAWAVCSVVVIAPTLFGLVLQYPRGNLQDLQEAVRQALNNLQSEGLCGVILLEVDSYSLRLAGGWGAAVVVFGAWCRNRSLEGP